MFEMPEVKYKLVVPEARLPELSTDGAAAYDIFVCRVLDKNTREVISSLEEPVEIKPGESVLFGTGIAMEIPLTHAAEVVSRSGSSIKCDIEAGHPGAPIDPDYRGEFRVFVRNMGKESFKAGKFMRITQLKFIPRIIVKWVKTEELSQTKRGENGLGSTGVY